MSYEICLTITVNVGQDPISHKETDFTSSTLILNCISGAQLHIFKTALIPHYYNVHAGKTIHS
jgi:hypothetical protein